MQLKLLSCINIAFPILSWMAALQTTQVGGKVWIQVNSNEHGVKDHWNSLSWALPAGIPVNVPQVYQDGTRAIALSPVMSDLTLIFPGALNSSVIHLTLSSISHQRKRQLNWIHKLVSAWKQLFASKCPGVFEIFEITSIISHILVPKDIKKKKNSTQLPAVRSD